VRRPEPGQLRVMAVEHASLVVAEIEPPRSAVVTDSLEEVVFEPAVVSAQAAALAAVEASVVGQGVQTSGSSTTLFCSAGSTMGLASTASPTTAVGRFTSA
jgi:hypothetical protein